MTENRLTHKNSDSPANKNARIAWALLSGTEPYDSRLTVGTA